MPKKIDLDFKKISQHQLVSNLSQYLNSYEKRVRDLVKEFDLRSREARDRSKEQLDKFALRLKAARGNVESRVNQVLSSEGHRINKGVNELLNYLKTVSKNEKLGIKVPSSKKRSKKAAPSATSAKKKASPKARKSSAVADTTTPAG